MSRLKRLSMPALLAALLVAPLSLPAIPAMATESVSVIVQEKPGAGDAPENAVHRLGGRVVAQLPVISGFVASVPAKKVHVLANRADVVVAEDASAGVSSDVRRGAAVVNEPTPSVHRDVVGAVAANGQGADGSGSTVALIDTGVADVPDLRTAIVPIEVGRSKQPCVNLSFERDCKDSFGHGTFMAGLIAGSGEASGGTYKGVAPAAKIVSLKVAGRDGGTTVGQIIMAIQWVVDNKDAYGIDVLNLSLGTESTRSYKVDPLNKAVQRAWEKGIAVVVAAGNAGSNPSTIAKPADDPLVIAVGATDDRTTLQTADDVIADFSSRGPTPVDGVVKPDIVAPGSRLVSLRSPGSAIEKEFPGGVDSTYRRGSGTSQSAAVVSGAVAALLSKHPNLSPDQLKFALSKSANPLSGVDVAAAGAGVLDLAAAVNSLPVGVANQKLEQANKTPHRKPNQPDGSTGNGRPALPSGGSWYGGSWYGGSWYGGSWYGGSWYGGSWYGGSWYGGSWYGGSWN